jgi:hypothetical protein
VSRPPFSEPSARKLFHIFIRGLTVGNLGKRFQRLCRVLRYQFAALIFFVWARKKTMQKLALVGLCSVLLLIAHGASGNADAELGPNLGGGYFGANVNSGTVVASKVYDGV